jgi:hypothetical protein
LVLAVASEVAQDGEHPAVSVVGLRKPELVQDVAVKGQAAGEDVGPARSVGQAALLVVSGGPGDPAGKFVNITDGILLPVVAA